MSESPHTQSNSKAYYFHCPGCGQNRQFFRAKLQRDGSMEGVVLIFGGIMSSLMLLADRSKPRVGCPECGHVFRRPAIPATLASGLAAIVFTTIILVPLIVLLFTLVPGFLDRQISNDVIASCYEFMMENSAAFFIGVLAVFAIQLIIVTVGYVIARIGQARTIKRTYATKPVDLAETQGADLRVFSLEKDAGIRSNSGHE
ncbi:MAG: hypothetical protein ACQKBV_00065 [Puniceicoccales bacterium]